VRFGFMQAALAFALPPAAERRPASPRRLEHATAGGLPGHRASRWVLAASFPGIVTIAAPRLRCKVGRVIAPAELETERQLCERARAGDREALGALLTEHGPRLYRSVLLPRLGNTAKAEEALSLTYLKVVERFARFEWQNVGVYPWLRVIALRVAIDLLRKHKRERLFDADDLEREIDLAEREARDARTLEAHDLAVARTRVVALLDRIHPRYAEAIRLRVLDELPRQEAADKLGVAVGTFDVVLHRAMAALRKVLDEEDRQP
jgi:RNA polymerase sigma factor (sigma-70 family)